MRSAGPVEYDVARQSGDFVIAKADGTAAYQLAVVLDDAAAGVTDVVRGDDLLASTPRQMLLYAALGVAGQVPRYTHLPLVTGPDGRRLAKRHGDTRLSFYRELGVPAARVLALLARWCGVDAGREATTDKLLATFDVAMMAPGPTVFTEHDDQWLLAATVARP
jgi:glutamyl-tRNA synthetase